MKYFVLLFTACVVSLICNSQTHIYLIPTIHGLHKTNQQYNYDSLRNIISKLNPDVIAVEIRSEDMNKDSNYLKKNYPFEMWMMSLWFPSVKIEGFDWLGKDLEGNIIPEDYWVRQSSIRKLQNQLNADSSFTSKIWHCNSFTGERMIILKESSLQSILTSNDAALTLKYYQCLKNAFENSPYLALTDFYNERNTKMQENLHQLFNKHDGKRLVILTGDDHYPYLLQWIQDKNFLLKPIFE